MRSRDAPLTARPTGSTSAVSVRLSLTREVVADRAFAGTPRHAAPKRVRRPLDPDHNYLTSAIWILPALACCAAPHAAVNCGSLALWFVTDVQLAPHARALSHVGLAALLQIRDLREREQGIHGTDTRMRVELRNRMDTGRYLRHWVAGKTDAC